MEPARMMRPAGRVWWPGCAGPSNGRHERENKSLLDLVALVFVFMPPITGR